MLIWYLSGVQVHNGGFLEDGEVELSYIIGLAAATADESKSG